jgi:DNA-binding NarL/FixJ family response regulator
VGRIRVLLVDDNDDFLDGLSAWLAHDPRLDIVGRAHSGPDAILAVPRLRPDLVLMDVSMPDMNGFEATRQIKSNPNAPLVVLIAFHDSRAARLEAWAAGADGFVAKAETTERLMPVVRDLLQRQERHEEQKVAASERGAPSAEPNPGKPSPRPKPDSFDP